MFGAPVVFNGGMRGGGSGGFDEDDDEDSGAFRKDNISLDQVCLVSFFFCSRGCKLIIFLG